MRSRQRNTAVALTVSGAALALGLMVAQPAGPATAPAAAAAPYYAAMEDRLADAVERRLADTGVPRELRSQISTLAREAAREVVHEVAVEVLADHAPSPSHEHLAASEGSTDAAPADPRNRALAMPYFSFSPGLRRGAIGN